MKVRIELVDSDIEKEVKMCIRDRYIGIGAYRGSETKTAFSDPKEIKEQLDYIESKQNCSGAVFFSYTSIEKNLAGVSATIASVYKNK